MTGNPLRYIDPTGEWAITLIPPAYEGLLYCAAIITGGAVGNELSTNCNPLDFSEQCSGDDDDDDDDCGSLTRAQAYRQAQKIAQIPRKDRDYIGFKEINESSRGQNCAELLRQGATHAGYRCGWNNKNRIEDHPEGHPHLPGEQHHNCPHLHVYGKNGETLAIIKYKRGG